MIQNVVNMNQRVSQVYKTVKHLTINSGIDTTLKNTSNNVFVLLTEIVEQYELQPQL